MLKPKGDPTKKNQFLMILSFLLIVGYIGFILGRSLWQNYQVDQEIQNLREQVVSLEDQNQRLKNLVLYYQTDSYLEKEARRKLMMRLPDEKVLALPDIKPESTAGSVDSETGQKEGSTPKESNYQLWIKYIFG
jgi:cell division protein FtsB